MASLSNLQLIYWRFHALATMVFTLKKREDVLVLFVQRKKCLLLYHVMFSLIFTSLSILHLRWVFWIVGLWTSEPVSSNRTRSRWQKPLFDRNPISCHLLPVYYPYEFQLAVGKRFIACHLAYITGSLWKVS